MHVVPKYTVVIALDKKHLEQFHLTSQTWEKHKPSLYKQPWLVIYDKTQLDFGEVRPLFKGLDFYAKAWPPVGVNYTQLQEGRWYGAQRQKMLSAFVHATAQRVSTDYWLKIDVDSVATGNDDWVNPNWFNGDPAIIAQPWGYTKPPEQMLELDQWVEQNKENEMMKAVASMPALHLKPNEGSDLVRHNRIISWCGFFNTNFTRKCSEAAAATCGEGKLPVPSQDGYMWYLAERMKYFIMRVRMSELGWEHRSTMKGIKAEVEKAMN